MAGRASGWLMGCGAGCIGLALVAAVILVFGFLYVKSAFEGVGEAAESHQELVDAHGRIESYVPAPDGAIPADRMELFLTVREKLSEPRAGLEALFADFPPDELAGEESVFKVLFAVFRSIGKMIEPIAEYVDLRNRLLLEHGMGIGEYVHIYGIAYYSWLGHPPDDGPVITKPTAGDQVGQRIMDGEGSTYGKERVRERYRRYMLAMLRNQRDSLPDSGGSAEADVWRKALSEEIERFARNFDHVPWPDGLPPAIEASLAPYRERLEASYSTTTNCFELPLREGETVQIKLDDGD